MADLSDNKDVSTKNEVSNSIISEIKVHKHDEENLEQSINTISSTPSDTVLDINRPTSTSDHVNIGVTAALNQCNLKLAKPYLRLLNVLALRPPPTSRDHWNCSKILFNGYKGIVVILVLTGYVLQYMSCFRRDRGFGYKEFSIYSRDKKYEEICQGSFIFSYFIPYILHFCGYLYALYSFSASGDDQLQCLLERVFLFTTNLRDGNRSQNLVVKMSHLFVILNFVWLLISSITTIVMMAEAVIEFKWVPYSESWSILVLKGFLVFCTIWHDAIQATVISNYCLQAQLLILYLQFLREKLLQHHVTPIEFMKEITDFKILLKFFNDELAPSVSLFSIVNLTWSFAGTFWLLHYDHIDKENLQTVGISFLNVLLWITISVAPFIQAARLTNACGKLQTVGHDVRTRPFVHQDTPDYKLDSMLLYASTLRLSSRLYRVPINGRYLCTFIVFSTVFILVLGQLHYINSTSN